MVNCVDHCKFGWNEDGELAVGFGKMQAEAPILCSPDMKSQLIGKDPDAGKDWRQKEKRVEEDEMVGWHHQLDRHESEQTLGDSKEHGSLECFSPWGCKESDTTEQLNKTLMSLIGGLSVEWWKENLS